jgi:hypothetical protein
MTHLNPIKTGLALGSMIALVHLVWSIIVALGWGQALVDFILWAHMVHVQYVVGPFDATACITLLIVTFLVGFLVGKVFAHIWNKVHK